MAGYVGLSEKEAEHLCELISTIESDESDNDLDVDDRCYSDEELLESDNEDAMEGTEVAQSIAIPGSSSDTTRKRNKEPTSRSSKAKRKKDINSSFSWTQDSFTPIIHHFDGSESGFHPDQEINENSDIVEYFEYFFSEELASKIAVETNRYFEYVTENLDKKKFSRLQKWQPTNHREIYLFIATTLLISRNKKLKLSDCWSRDPLLSTPIIGKTMTRDRYLLILRLLHFCNNDEQVTGNRLFKLDYVLKFLKNRFKTSFTPFINLCIDESLVLYKGKLAFKQYIKTKRHRFGVKFFVLADVETNFVLDFIIYTGKTTSIKQNEDLGISGSIVATMMEPYLGKGYHLYTDNWYTSPTLAEYLHENKTNCCGTVRSNRMGMPQLSDVKVKGSYVSKHTDKILVIKWFDRRVVHMLTTIHENKIVPTGKKEWQTGEMKKKPHCIKEYNENMGTIDKIDMLLSSVECLRKCTKWYKKIFFHLIDLVVINSHAAYKMKTGEHITLADFQLTLIRQLIQKYIPEETVTKSRVGRPSSKDLPTRLASRHFPNMIPAVPGGKKASQRICVVCKHTQLGQKKRKDSRFECRECGVGLCIVPCFEKYHTLQKY